MMNIPILMGITSGAALLLGFLLILHPQKINVIANRWLGLFVFTLGLAILEIFLVSQNFQLNHPKLFDLVGLSRFLSTPFLYLGVLYFTSLDKTFKKKYIWHFLPFVIFLIFRIPFFITGKNFEFSYSVSRIVFFIFQIALPLQSIIYWYLSFIKLQKHIKNLGQFSSSTEKIDLSWLKHFLLVLAIIIFVWFNIIFFDIKNLVYFTPLFYLFSVFFLAYFSLQQKEIFDFNKSDLNDLSEIISNQNVKQKRLSESQMEILNKKLQILIESEKVYLENELSLPKLAQKIGTTCNETSFLINEFYNENFYNFVNKYRVEEAKMLLLSEKYNQLNIIGIAYQSGFNSKTTFNTTFKKFTGSSPTEFVRLNSTLNIQKGV